MEDAPAARRARSRRLLRDAGSLFTGTTVASVLGLAAFFVVARSLGPTEFGALVLVFTFGTAVTRLCGFQSWQAIIRYASIYKSDGAQAELSAFLRLGVLIDCVAAAVAATLTYAVAAGAAEVFDWSDRVEAGVRLYAVAVLFTIAGAPTAVLRLYRRFDLLAAYQVAAASIRLALVGLVFVMAPTFEHYLYAWIASHIASHVILNVAALGPMRRDGLLNAEVRRRKRMVDVSDRAMWRYFAVTNLDGMVRVTRELDAQVVALFVDEAAAGILRLARQIALFAGRMVDAFFDAIYPELAELVARRRWAEFSAFVKDSALRVGAFALIPLFGFLLLGAPLVDVVFGEGFESVYGVANILLLGVVVWGFSQPFAPALMSLGAVGRMLVNHALASAVYMLGLIWLVQAFQMSGAAWATVLFNAFWGVLTVATFVRHAPRPDPRTV